ncbi:MAG: DUF1786 family protein [Dehalococcoidia bacterium]|nr:DUF1786 family protein [Dehalococcoidia bacterium]
MRLLCIDIGAGTQDVLLLDTTQRVENSVQLILPSPTQIAARHIVEATKAGKPLLLTGVTMGGGAISSALKRHLKAGLPAFATLLAALTFDDDPQQTTDRGVKLLSEDEAGGLHGAHQVELRDLDVKAILKAVEPFTGPVEPDAVAVAVLDHGEAPRGVSNRLFRFEYLKGLVEERRCLEQLCYLAAEVPPSLTRMLSVVRSHDRPLPLLLMDTGAAAALGAGLDGRVSRYPHRLSLNLGNAHTLGVHLQEGNILGLFEHHTGLLPAARLRRVVDRFLAGELTNQEVWDDGGHGCFILKTATKRPPVVITGPNRARAAGSGLRAYPAAPYGAMMLAGCFGLAAAWGYRSPEWAGEIGKALGVRLSL